MPYDAFALAAVTDEVSAVVGGQVQRIIQPSAASIALSIYAGGLRRWLVLSADARFARVNFSEGRLAKAFETPSAFVMLLRKYLESGRIVRAEAAQYERVLSTTCTHGGVEVRLVAEIMGKHSNVILVDAANRILGALKLVPPTQSRVRPVLPGRPYLPPPAHTRDAALFGPGERLDPCCVSDELLTALRALPPETALKDILLGILPGCSPFIAAQIACRTPADPAAHLSSLDLDAVLTAAQSFYRLYHTRAWAPATFLDARGRPDFAPYIPGCVSDITPRTTMSEAISHCLDARESSDALGTVRRSVGADVERALAAASRRVESLRAGLTAGEGSNAVMMEGQLILAYQHAVTDGADRLVISDLEMSIPLDPRFTPAENAERRFKRYRKLRDATRRIPALLIEAEAEVDRLRDLSIFTTLAESEPELRELARELALQSNTLPSNRDRARGPRRLTRDGYILLAGRNARENEEITFRLSSRGDLWLHARERTGAHVVLRGDHPPDEIVASAAAVAAYLSEGRTDTAVDVDVASVRDVRKVPGGAPGRVTYRNFRTVRVEPSMEHWDVVARPSASHAARR